MAANSHIEWTEATWNPVTGCTKISAGCKNCYAERLALRLQAMGNHATKTDFASHLHEDVVDLPRSWRTPRTIFVNSMSDLFHQGCSARFHSAGVCNDARLSTAHISNSHKEE